MSRLVVNNFPVKYTERSLSLRRQLSVGAGPLNHEQSGVVAEDAVTERRHRPEEPPQRLGHGQTGPQLALEMVDQPFVTEELAGGRPCFNNTVGEQHEPVTWLES